MFDSPERRKEFLLNLLALAGVTIIVTVLLILALHFLGPKAGLGELNLFGSSSAEDEYSGADATTDEYDGTDDSTDTYDDTTYDDTTGDDTTYDETTTEDTTSTEEETTTDGGDSTSSSGSSSIPKAGNVVLTRPKVVAFTNTAGNPDYAYFFSYINNGEDPVFVNGFDVSVEDDTGASIDEPMYNYAPSILDGGKIGYAAYIGLNFNNNYPDSGVTVNASADFEAETSTESPLKCTAAQFVTPTTGNTIEGNVTGETVAVTVANNTSTAYQYAHVVVGLIGSDDSLIGAATGTADALEANGSIEMECDKIVLLDGYTTDDVAKVRARARPGPEEG